MANFNYSDNVARAMRQLGRIILSWIPHYYDIPRMVDIVYPDGTHDIVPGNQPYIKLPDGSVQAVTQQQLQQAQQAGATPLKVRMHDLVNFRGTVTISTGPSYQTKRQEAVNSILALVQSFPQIMTVAGDLLVGWMDWNGAKEVAARLKAILPPGIQAEDDGEITPARFAQLNTQFQQLQQAFQQLKFKVATKQPDLELRKYLGELQAKANIEVAQINKATDDGKLVSSELSQILDLGRQAQAQRAQDEQELRLKMIEQAHEQGLQAQQQDHERQLAMQQQQHEQELQANAPEPASAQSPA